MPLIPRAAENTQMQVSSPVPIGDTNSARYGGNAIEKFGSELQDFASKQLSFDRDLQLKEGHSAIENVTKDAALYAKQNAAPDGSDYRDKFYEYAQPKLDEVQNKYTDPYVRKSVGGYLDTVKNSMDTSIAIQSSAMRESNNWDRVDGLQNTRADSIRESARTLSQDSLANLVAAEVKDQNNLLEGIASKGISSKENVAKARAAMYTKFSNALIMGMAEGERPADALRLLQANQQTADMVTKYDPDKAKELGLIDSREATALKAQGKTFDLPILTTADKMQMPPALAAVMSQMPPDKKAHLIDAMSAELRKKTEIRLSDLHASLKGFSQLGLSGEVITDSMIADQKNAINSNTSMTPIARIRTMDDVNSTVVANRILQVMGSTPREKWQDLIDSYDKKMSLAAAEAAKIDPKMAQAESDPAVLANRMQTKEVLQRSMHTLATQQEKDPAGTTLFGDNRLQNLQKASLSGQPEDMQKFVRESMLKQQFLGLQPAVLTKSDAISKTQYMGALQNSSQVNDYITGLQSRYGEYFPKVMEELAKVDKKLVDYKAVGYAPPEIRTDLIDSIKNEPAINEAFKKDAVLSEKNKILEYKVTGTMNNFAKVIASSSNDLGTQETINSVRKLVELQARRDLIKNPDASIDDVVKKAYNTAFAGTYDIQSGGKSSVIVPRYINNHPIDMHAVKGFLEVYSRPENFGDLNVAVPDKEPQKTSFELAGAKIPIADSRSAFYYKLAQTGRWVHNADQTGVKLMQMTDTGLQPVYDNMGKRVERSYNDIHFTQDQKVKDAMTILGQVKNKLF